jgi:hypothetical protein
LESATSSALSSLSFKHFLQTPIALEMSGDVTPQTAQVAIPPP